MEQGKLVNRVANSVITTLDLAALYPKAEDVVVFDLKGFLFMELMLKEKDFREGLKQHDWEQYKNKYVAVTCSADAIIPVWAYMLVSSYLQPQARMVLMGSEAEVKQELLLRNIRTLSMDEYVDARVVVKGCGDLPISAAAYLEITNVLMPVARSIMYGEPCSTVPVFKRKSSTGI
ncbi:MAG TPA: DUF2480 family protein [Phnomibacter sp.]|nr:DUF2480 family protein [Phnomibacter sp.]